MLFKSEEVVGYNVGEDVAPIFNARICLKGEQPVGKQICNRKGVMDYFREHMTDAAVETFMLVTVDCQCRVLCTAVLGVGGLTSVTMDNASICKIALLSNANGVFFCHNHPGGTCCPSYEDLTATRQLVSALKMFNITVHDHIIMCPNEESYSMAQHGDI